MPEVFVCPRDELTDDTRKVVKLDGKEVVVFERGDRVFALSNTCLHMGGPVGRGEIIPKVEVELGEHQTYVMETFSDTTIHIVCPWHGFEYDIETGVLAADPGKRLPTYEVVERNGDVYVVV
jgi:nitrite reductase (NADH) small subunit